MADAGWRQEAAVNRLEDIKQEPWRFDFFSAMRRVERSFPDRPRIGDSSSIREEYLSLGQEPYMDFPASNLRGAARPTGLARCPGRKKLVARRLCATRPNSHIHP